MQEDINFRSLCVDDEITKGSWLRSKSGTISIVLNIRGEGYIQKTPVNHSQSMNYSKDKIRYDVYDGRFLNTRSEKEIYSMNNAIYYPNYKESEIKLFNF